MGRGTLVPQSVHLRSARCHARLDRPLGLGPGDPRLACRKRAAEGRHDLSKSHSATFGHCLSCFGGRRGSWPQLLPFWPGSRTASLFPIRAAWCAIRGRRRTTLPRARTFGNEGSRCSTNCIRKGYQRIIVVGHSLGSILAYDLVGYFWARRDASRTLVEGTAEFEALRRLEQSLLAFEKAPSDEAVAAFRQARQNLSRLLRQRPPPQGERPDARWLITDLVTLGSPLAHADFLLAESTKEMDERILRWEFPTCPPVREVLDSMVARRGEKNRSSAR